MSIPALLPDRRTREKCGTHRTRAPPFRSTKRSNLNALQLQRVYSLAPITCIYWRIAMRFAHFATVLGALLCYETLGANNLALGQDIVISGTVKDLVGMDLTTARLNEIRPGQAALSADQFRAIMSIVATPRGRGAVRGTFDPGNARYQVRLRPQDFSAVDKIVTITFDAGGLLDRVALEGVAIEAQTISVTMPLALTGGCESCCRHWQCTGRLRHGRRCR
jgi:hypothetical protein